MGLLICGRRSRCADRLGSGPGGILLPVAPKDDAEKIGVKLLQHVVRGVVRERSSPVLEHARRSAVLRRIVDRRDSLLEQLAAHLGNVESGMA